jgi:signal transduction histidine kinase
VTPDTQRAAAESGPVRAVEAIAGALSELDAAAPAEAFYDRICEQICRLTSLERAIVFRYDEELREVRAAGSHAVDHGALTGRKVSVDSAPAVRRAFEADRIIETEGLEGSTDPVFLALVRGDRLCWTPMAASGRWVGVIVAARAAGAGPLPDGERSFLFALGKATALATVARMAERQRERAGRMRARLDLAREIHDGVMQRLFGVSLALERLGEGDEAARRCGEELQHALGDLRAALERPLAPELPRTAVSPAHELERLGREDPHLPVRLVEGDPALIPPALGPLVQAVLGEGVRNARKHGAPTAIEVALRREEGTLVLEVSNDGAGTRARGLSSGVGLRLAGLEALQHGGVVEYGPRPGGRWCLRLVVPTGD